MRKGDKFYKVEALVSKEDIDNINNKLKSEFNSKSSIIFKVLEDNGIKVYEVSVNSASARIQERHIVLDISGNGESSTRKGFNRFEIEGYVENKEDKFASCKKSEGD